MYQNKKILLVANTARFLVLFEENDMRILTDMGYEIHCASNFDAEKDETSARSILEERGAVTHQVDIVRSPLSKANVRAYRQLLALMKDYHFDAVHCHTPMGAALARVAAHKRGISPVIYTVHGLHFYKGAPLQNWLLYYPIEKTLAHWTDLIITINQEDYERAKALGAQRVEYIPGVGIDTEKYKTNLEARNKIRSEFGISEGEIVLLTVGDLVKNKNQKTILSALEQIKNPSVKYILCGSGPELDSYKNLAIKLGIEGQVLFAGYRKDILSFYQAADIFVFPSHREGLSVAVMEAMASGLPCVVSKIRGNVDLMGGENQDLLEPEDIGGFANRIRELAGDDCYREREGRKNKGRIKEYDLKKVNLRMREIYDQILPWMNSR